MPLTPKEPFRTDLTITEIRASAWNASMGSEESYRFLSQANRRLAKLANSRLRDLEKAGYDMFAYDRAITYLSNNDRTRFSTKLPSMKDYKGMVEQLSELITFINAKTSTVAGAKKALDAKIDMLSKQTGTKYTDQQRMKIGKLIGNDSISTLLREVRGNSDEVIEVIEELALSDASIDQITSVIDKHLAGYNPFTNSPFFDNMDYMAYDPMMDELRKLAEIREDGD